MVKTKEWPRTVKATYLSEYIGKYIGIWGRGGVFAARIEDIIQEDDGPRIVISRMPEHDKKESHRFVPDREIPVYNDDTLPDLLASIRRVSGD